jgi:DNA-binding CsgD family transcriptional regulator
MSPREEQVLRRLLAGGGEKQAARAIGVSPRTVHVYVRAIYRMFRVDSQSALLALFIPNGAVERLLDGHRTNAADKPLPDGDWLATIIAMDSASITPAQAEKLRADLARQLDYLNRLCARMQMQRWPLEDQLCGGPACAGGDAAAGGRGEAGGSNLSS